ncbi:hypothetical protein [Sphingomonas paeninsulae]|uniref:hypothetical protein n=1 Tax=Sphingomonas paeninsulae TaxID=2319844 RepID=UPI0013CF1E6B|nr:hypothetical protein [Sphingomonas paeninsulae]
MAGTDNGIYVDSAPERRADQKVTTVMPSGTQFRATISHGQDSSIREFEIKVFFQGQLSGEAAHIRPIERWCDR